MPPVESGHSGVPPTPIPTRCWIVSCTGILSTRRGSPPAFFLLPGKLFLRNLLRYYFRSKHLPALHIWKKVSYSLFGIGTASYLIHILSTSSFLFSILVTHCCITDCPPLKTGISTYDLLPFQGLGIQEWLSRVMLAKGLLWGCSQVTAGSQLSEGWTGAGGPSSKWLSNVAGISVLVIGRIPQFLATCTSSLSWWGVSSTWWLACLRSSFLTDLKFCSLQQCAHLTNLNEFLDSLATMTPF